MSQNLTQLLETDEKIKVAGIDIDGITRGKFLIKDKFFKSLDTGFGKCPWLLNIRLLQCYLWMGYA
jgi:hypothetical protein